MLHQSNITNPQARVSGERARHNNVLIIANPHPPGSDDFKEWESGWNDADSALNKKHNSSSEMETHSKLFS